MTVDLGQKLELSVYAGEQELEIVVNSLDSVLDLKRVIERKTGIEPSELRLKFRGKDLKTGALQEAGVGNGSSIFLDGVIDLHLQCTDEKKEKKEQIFYVLDLWLTSKLYYLVQRKHGINMPYWYFEIGGRRLPVDNKTFKENGVQSGSIVLIKDRIFNKSF
ncbi:hypothetical protein M3Y97_01098700 [Aphelenchoides bicaudatus]|nr:hypothetical protein M3Y97_01098700 [Aphelenchoides bicaudatus]